MKRLFDIVLSSLILILSSPAVLFVMVLVRIKLGSPVLYKQQRPGYKGRPFLLYKFRTMTNERDKNGEELPDNVRLTPFGQIIRKYSLDELPQLINVIKGDISLVGPRPLKMEYLSLYTPFQARRHDVKPGITGWAQVNGRNAISWERRFELDIWYIENHSFLLDIKILLMTFRKILKPEDISSEGHVTMPEFKGSKSKVL